MLSDISSEQLNQITATMLADYRDFHHGSPTETVWVGRARDREAGRGERWERDKKIRNTNPNFFIWLEISTFAWISILNLPIKTRLNYLKFLIKLFLKCNI